MQQGMQQEILGLSQGSEENINEVSNGEGLIEATENNQTELVMEERDNEEMEKNKEARRIFYVSKINADNAFAWAIVKIFGDEGDLKNSILAYLPGRNDLREWLSEGLTESEIKESTFSLALKKLNLEKDLFRRILDYLENYKDDDFGFERLLKVGSRYFEKSDVAFCAMLFAQAYSYKVLDYKALIEKAKVNMKGYEDPRPQFNEDVINIINIVSDKDPSELLEAVLYFQEPTIVVLCKKELDEERPILVYVNEKIHEIVGIILLKFLRIKEFRKRGSDLDELEKRFGISKDELHSMLLKKDKLDICPWWYFKGSLIFTQETILNMEEVNEMINRVLELIWKDKVFEELRLR